MTEQNQKTEVNEVALNSWAQTIKAEADKIKAEALEIVVTDATDKTTIKLARETRLKVKAMRIAVENRRKELKDYFLKTGKMIDSVASDIKAMLEPIESHLEQQEKFAEIQAKKERDERIQKRTPMLAELGQPLPDFAIDMPEADFMVYLDGLKKAKAEAEEAERQRIAEEEAKRKAEEEERARIKAENDRLKKEAEEAEAKRRAEEAERKAQEEKRLAEEREKERARIEAERKAQDELRKAEEARLKAEREAKESQERAERARIEAERVAEQQKALKIEGETFEAEIPAFEHLINQIKALEIPSCKSESGFKLSGDIEILRQKLINFIESKIK
jgi:hypothetical protein